MVEAEGNPPPKKENPVKKYIPPADDYAYPLLEDIILSKKTREDLERIVFGIEHPSVYEMAGLKPNNSFLFNGPPGTGKTFSSKGIRNQLFKTGHNVTWALYDVGVYGTAYINMGAVRIQQYFDNCRKFASDGHIVLSFWDEADVIFGNRATGQGHKEDTKNLETIMKNMNDIKQHCTGVYFIMCTNFPELMDAAAMRSGRVDKIVNFELPGAEQLLEAYKHYTKKINDNAIYRVCDVRRYESIIKDSEGFNFADVQNVVDTSVRALLYEFVNDDGLDVARPPKLLKRHLVQTIKELKAERSEIGVSYKKKRIGFT